MTASKPAFPNQPCRVQDGDTLRIYEPTPGMSIRQYYKAAALTGLNAQADARTFSGEAKDLAAIRKWRMSLVKADVETAAMYADQMLSEDAEFEGRKE